MNGLFGRLSLLLGAALFATQAATAQEARFTVSSPAVSGNPQVGFSSGLTSEGRIDPAYAAKAGAPANPTSLPLLWKHLPAGTTALAIVMQDPDAAAVAAAFGRKAVPFIHWLAADIDPTLGGLPANASASDPSFAQGKNGAGRIGYLGPQPPANVPSTSPPPLIHVYELTLYALSAPTGLQNGFSLADLQAALAGKILGTARLLFSYSN